MKTFLLTLPLVVLMIVGLLFAGIGLVAGFIWEHMRAGFIAGKMSPDWLGALLQKHFPKDAGVADLT